MRIRPRPHLLLGPRDPAGPRTQESGRGDICVPEATECTVAGATWEWVLPSTGATRRPRARGGSPPDPPPGGSRTLTQALHAETVSSRRASPWPGHLLPPRGLGPVPWFLHSCGIGLVAGARGSREPAGWAGVKKMGRGSLEKGACCCKVTEGVAYGPTRATCTCGSSGLLVGVDTEPA